MFSQKSQHHHKVTRTEALAELSREADELYRKKQLGEISSVELERHLEELQGRYETPFDRFLAAG